MCVSCAVQKMQRRLQALLAMDEDKRRVEAEVLRVNWLLVDRCPRCAAMFLNFTGCCALKCAACPCHFCAW